MKKNLLLLTLLLLIPYLLQAQVGIGTEKPHGSAALEIESNEKGLLIPRLTFDQKNAIQNPAESLLIYQIDGISGFYFFNGKGWDLLKNPVQKNADWEAVSGEAQILNKPTISKAGISGDFSDLNGIPEIIFVADTSKMLLSYLTLSKVQPVLASKVDLTAFESEIARAKAAESANAGNILQNSGNINTLNTKVAQNSTDILNNASGILTNASKISENTGNINTLNTKVAQNSTDILNNASGIFANAGSITTLNNAVVQNSADILTNTADISTNKIGIGNLNTAVSQNSLDILTNASAIQTNSSLIFANAGNINTLNTAVVQNSADILSNTADISTNKIDISNLNTSVGQNSLDILSNTSAIQTNASLIFANAGNINTLNTAVTQNISDIQTNATDISTNKIDISNLKTSVGQNSLDILSNTSAIQTNASLIFANAGNINTLNTAVTQNSSDIQTNATDISTNKEDINTLNTTVSQNSTDILINASNIALKENFENKSNDITLSDETDILFPTVKAVKTYVDAKAVDLETKASGILPIENGGTGSEIKNFVDLTTFQTIEGTKVFNSNLNIRGITVGTGGSDDLSNVAIGYNPLINNTGSNNTAVGDASLQLNTLGDRNTAMGSQALQLNTLGANNTAIGNSAMNTSISGNYNAAFGAISLQANIDGSQNTAIGAGALDMMTTGNNNAVLGFLAGRTASNGDNTEMNNSVLIGVDSRPNASGQTNQIVIGYEAVGNGNNTVQLGNNNITDVKTSGKLTTGAITLPNTDGITGQVLATNGDGAVSWITPYVASSSDFVDLTSTQMIGGNKTFTGIISGITSEMVGLGNVDNTSDLNKPISIATQISLEFKAPLESPALTGTPTAPTAEPGTSSEQIATTEFVNLGLKSINTLEEGKVYLGNEFNVATEVAISGDISLNNSGISAIGANKVNSSMILDGTILTADIANNAINTDKLATLSVTSDKLAAFAVTGDKLSTFSVTADKLDNFAVTGDKLAISSVTSDKLATSSVTAGKLASLSVTSDKLATFSVTADKLDMLAVTTEKIADASITTAKILDGTITNTDISASAEIEGIKINPNFGAQNIITSGQLTTGEITFPNTKGNPGQILSTDGNSSAIWTYNLANGTTANTQHENDNSDRVATTEYVDRAVSGGVEYSGIVHLNNRDVSGLKVIFLTPFADNLLILNNLVGGTAGQIIHLVFAPNQPFNAFMQIMINNENSGNMAVNGSMYFSSTNSGGVVLIYDGSFWRILNPPVIPA
jgi:hypothetical protein